jgi:protein ImuB
MSLRLPRFALERRLRRRRQPPTFALSVRDGPRERIVTATPAAEARGVKPGLPLAAARALCSGLEVAPLDPDGEALLLARLAAALLRFTPDVCREPDPALPAGAAALLLEVGRTAFHFGGEAALAEQVAAVCARAGFSACIGVAETPEAARVLARAAGLAGDPAPRHAVGATRDWLAPLPCEVLAPPPDVATALRALGLRTVGELLALPRAGLATRTSIAFVQQLQRLQGELEEPLVRIAPPERLEEEHEFEVPVADAGAWLAAARGLLLPLLEELAASGRAPQRLCFEFVPPASAGGVNARGGGVPWTIEMAPGVPTRDVALLLTLLSHRLEAGAQAPAIEKLRCRVAATVPLAAEQEALFCAGRDRAVERAAALLIDRLRMRLSSGQVQGVALVADPRPERAFRFTAAEAGGAVGRGGAAGLAAGLAAGARPLALEAMPRRCAVECDACGRPVAWRDIREPLRRVRGPERITGGWWDGHDVERDYFEVERQDGQRCWLYRDAAGAWFRHGEFG